MPARSATGARAPLAYALALLILAAVPPGALAQDEGAERDAIARALFQEGVALAQEERFAEASDRFRRAYALRPTPAIAYNLATALAHDGELVEAAEVLRRLLREPDLASDVREAATESITRIEPRIGRLTVRLEGASSDVEVALDERVLAAEELGIGIPVDPGPHVVVARRDGDEIARAELELDEGGEREVALEIPERRVAADPAALALSGEEASARDAAPGDDTGMWIGVGVGLGLAVAIGVAVTIAVLLWPAEHEQPIAGNAMPGVIEW